MIHPTAFIASTASIMGDVTIGAEASVWYGAVLRADLAPIVIGDQTNLQDGSFVARAQAGVSSPAYEAGPYAPSEYQVDLFCTWYVERLLERVDQ